MKLKSEALRRFYVDKCLFAWPRLLGGLWLRFYRFIYPGFHIGRFPAVWGRFNVMMFENASIHIGERLRLVSHSSRSAITLFSRAQLTVFPGAHIVIGDNVALSGTTISCKKQIEIGDGTMVAPNVIIVDSDFHVQWPPENRMSSDTSQWDREVVIGKNVWIGMNSVILKGVTIGDNSLIGAGSIVTKDVPANVVVSGNPARIIRSFESSSSAS